ncbi:OmpA/MotB domain protein [Pseudopedobacter saltans DSM 12145]|uniref:OmpA/MotB domain protein n=1 Tax=Pseudopedobacter saltans (strain ATCC 51119 / DSM 12145 / JCM 21818 / CCUG 39354 / LMG 10337 / NBRC 100064 / NCIMB 13643) TaxID=762903 RepID=F0S5I8_PSESL|nr:OmpA family protein [Pseudopedobacter saltans]ADY53152.1 OmpA/MotB domain protein [Pseudopedobacter saltans DSM 12145]
MKVKSLLALAFSLLLMSSCVVMSKKKYQKLLSDQDSLANGWSTAQVKIESLEEELTRLKRDTAILNQKVNSLNGELADLRGNYSTLRSNSSSEINRLSEDLKRREQRLKEVEEMIRKRDEASNALKNKLQKALLGFQDKGLTVEMRDGKVYVSLTDKLLFASGSIVIDERGKQALHELAVILNTQPEINIAVEGHTDNQRVVNLGQIKDNWDLSVLRATSVVRFLTVDEKISPNRIMATGKGEFQPISTDNSAESRSKNRRIEIVLSPKLDELFNLLN